MPGTVPFDDELTAKRSPDAPDMLLCIIADWRHRFGTARCAGGPRYLNGGD